MPWFPTVTSLKLIFTQLQASYESVKKDHLMKEYALEGVVDKVLNGEPFQNSSFWDRAAILVRDIIFEHPFTDGNKRVAFLGLTLFLYKNGYEWRAKDEVLIKFTLDLASGQLTKLKSINKWIIHHVSKPIYSNDPLSAEELEDGNLLVGIIKKYEKVLYALGEDKE